MAADCLQTAQYGVLGVCLCHGALLISAGWPQAGRVWKDLSVPQRPAQLEFHIHFLIKHAKIEVRWLLFTALDPGLTEWIFGAASLQHSHRSLQQMRLCVQDCYVLFMQEPGDTDMLEEVLLLVASRRQSHIMYYKKLQNREIREMLSFGLFRWNIIVVVDFYQ